MVESFDGVKTNFWSQSNPADKKNSERKTPNWSKGNMEYISERLKINNEHALQCTNNI